jgi:nickel/cobalt transporter (NicO) family protein
VSSTGPALLAAAAGVGLGHAILPDHWVPLAVLGRTRRYPLSRIARLSGLAGVAHVIVSLVLGGVIIAIGLQFRSTIQSAQDAIIGCVLIATAIGFAALELTGRGHGHDHSHHHDHGHSDHNESDRDPSDHDHADHAHADHEHQADHDHDHADHEHQADHDHNHDHSRNWHGLAAVMVPFGAAASPDLTILPVFLAATTAGVVTAIGSVVVFAAVTIGTIVGLTLAAARGGYEIRGQWLERWGNVFTAATLLVIGTLVLTGTL